MSREIVNTYRDTRTGAELTQKEFEQLPEGLQVDEDTIQLIISRHADCGGQVEISAVGTNEESYCRRCGARWRWTFGENPGLIRLPAYGGIGL